MVDDGGHTSHFLAVFVCHEVVCFAKLKGCIFFRVEGGYHVLVQIGYTIGIILVKLVIETYEPFKFFSRTDFSYFY